MEIYPPLPAEQMAKDAAAPEDPLAPATWRLIVDDEPRSGPANMAIDQAIAEACAEGKSLPTLRFYQWKPPAVSLGRHQLITDLNLPRVQTLGYEVVRRPTGGRAILHTDEFTYSVAGAAGEPRLRGGVMDSYLRISNALVAGLHRLGATGAGKAPATSRAGADVSAACFEVPSAYEITVGLQKLMGSAQSRRAGYVLQHGSLPLVGDITRLIDVLDLEETESLRLRAELARRATTLAAVLGEPDSSLRVTFSAVADAMQAAFAGVLALGFKVGPPSPAEMRRAAQLIREQYGDGQWTQQR